MQAVRAIEAFCELHRPVKTSRREEIPHDRCFVLHVGIRTSVVDGMKPKSRKMKALMPFFFVKVDCVCGYALERQLKRKGFGSTCRAKGAGFRKSAFLSASTHSLWMFPSLRPRLKVWTSLFRKLWSKVSTCQCLSSRNNNAVDGSALTGGHLGASRTDGGGQSLQSCIKQWKRSSLCLGRESRCESSNNGRHESRRHL